VRRQLWLHAGGDCGNGGGLSNEHSGDYDGNEDDGNGNEDDSNGNEDEDDGNEGDGCEARLCGGDYKYTPARWAQQLWGCVPIMGSGDPVHRDRWRQ
jgi:hypothetical protein